MIGAVSEGELVIDLMNAVGYDYAILGNHEFDYGMDQLAKAAEKADFEYTDCNITYNGTKENKLAFLKPYIVHDFGDVQVGFVGVATPLSIATSTPTFFQEDGEFVYDFAQGENGAIIYKMVQDAVDAARADGADYVLWEHLTILLYTDTNEDVTVLTEDDRPFEEALADAFGRFSAAKSYDDELGLYVTEYTMEV